MGKGVRKMNGVCKGQEGEWRWLRVEAATADRRCIVVSTSSNHLLWKTRGGVPKTGGQWDLGPLWRWEHGFLRGS